MHLVKFGINYSFGPKPLTRQGGVRSAAINRR
jgi:hypothetical protein